jgi:hypothetical protein
MENKKKETTEKEKETKPEKKNENYLLVGRGPPTHRSHTGCAVRTRRRPGRQTGAPERGYAPLTELPPGPLQIQPNKRYCFSLFFLLSVYILKMFKFRKIFKSKKVWITKCSD